VASERLLHAIEVPFDAAEAIVGGADQQRDALAHPAFASRPRSARLNGRPGFESRTVVVDDAGGALGLESGTALTTIPWSCGASIDADSQSEPDCVHAPEGVPEEDTVIV
jgi:hypothetical protein